MMVRSLSPRCDQRGFTFIEVMVTLVILSVGIVGIFKSLLISLDQIDYLTHRLYASTTMENLMFQKERMLRDVSELSLNLGEKIDVPVGNKNIRFDQNIEISEIESYPDLFSIDVTLSWKEGDRKILLRQSGYLWDSTYAYKKSNL